MMPRCDEIARVISTDEVAQLSWSKRLSIRFHLAMCRHCRRYERQIREIGDAVRAFFSGRQEVNREIVERLESNILKNIPGATPSSDD